MTFLHLGIKAKTVVNPSIQEITQRYNRYLSPLVLFIVLFLHHTWMQGILFFNVSRLLSETFLAETAVQPKLQGITTGTTIRAMLAHWTGPVNLAAYEAWIVFHHKKWKVTDVDLHVHWELVEYMKAYFSDPNHTGGANVHVYDHYIDKNVTRAKWGVHRRLQKKIIQRTLDIAKQHGDGFAMFFDADEFLDSNDFDTIESMFASNDTVAVTLPIFTMDYTVCSGVALTYGSLGYQAVRPVRTNFTNNETEAFYTNPCTGCCGQRKYIIRPDRWNDLGHVHDPINCLRKDPYEGIIDMTGRAQESQHARLLHLRTGVGIQADTSFQACLKVPDCELYERFKHKCIKSININETAPVRLVPSMIQTILSNYPLFRNI